jgi:hypothetical protein
MDTNTAATIGAPDCRQDAEEEKQRRNMEKLRGELGPLICSALDDPGVIEIMVNPDGTIWLDYAKSGMEDTGKKIASRRLMAALGTIAAMLGTKINAHFPSLEGELPLDGSRILGTIPPISQGPGIAIRKHCSVVVPLNDYVEEKRISEVEGFQEISAGNGGQQNEFSQSQLLSALEASGVSDRNVNTAALMQEAQNAQDTNSYRHKLASEVRVTNLKAFGFHVASGGSKIFETTAV